MVNKKKFFYPFNLCKMKVNIGTGARDLQKYFDISKPGGQFRISLNKARSRGVLRLRRGVLRLRIQLRVPGPTAFKNFGATAFKNPPLLRLRIYRIT